MKPPPGGTFKRSPPAAAGREGSAASVAVGPMKPPSVVTFKRSLAAAADGEGAVDGEGGVEGDDDVDGEADADGEDADPDEKGAVEGPLEGADAVGAVATEQP